MPAKAAPPLQDQLHGNNGVKPAARIRSGESLVEDTSPSGTQNQEMEIIGQSEYSYGVPENRPRRKLQKSPSGIKVQKRQNDSSTASSSEQKAPMAHARKPSVRKSTGPMGGRPQESLYMKL
jgi:hypothetical protein